MVDVNEYEVWNDTFEDLGICLVSRTRERNDKHQYASASTA